MGQAESKRLLVLLPGGQATPNEKPVSSKQLRHWLTGKQRWRQLFRYRAVEARAYDIRYLPETLLVATALRLLTLGSCRVVDRQGQVWSIGLFSLLRRLWLAARDRLTSGRMLHRINAALDDLAATSAGSGPALDCQASPVYLRTDLVYGIRSGGSVGHIAGVLNNLARHCAAPRLFTSDIIPTVDAGIATQVFAPPSCYQDFAELPWLAANLDQSAQLDGWLAGSRTAFIYQRYSLYNLVGLRQARRLQVPFVLEYNGSEVWINKNWAGKGLRYQDRAERIERLNLEAADLIVVVSQPLRDELLQHGIRADKILVNPNGVNPDRYRPDIDGDEVRRRYGLGERKVIGFIGTFGAWHGAEVLPEAFAELLRLPGIEAEQIHLLMIGDGSRMPEVREIIDRHGIGDQVTLPGLVDQDEGPAHLAACDLLISPHVPNPDGSPFFGSPTKLFEYMAMGRAIVASDLDQIGQILDHEQDALLVPPDDPKALAEAMARLLTEPALADQLAANARAKAVRDHSWRRHTERIMEALRRVCRGEPAQP